MNWSIIMTRVAGNPTIPWLRRRTWMAGDGGCPGGRDSSWPAGLGWGWRNRCCCWPASFRGRGGGYRQTSFRCCCRQWCWGSVGVGVGEGVGISVLVGVREGVGLGGGVGASPSTRKVPEIFHTEPTKIRTSYSPGCHSQGSASQSVNPKPPEPPSHGLLSKNTRSSPRYHRALHCEPFSMPS